MKTRLRTILQYLFIFAATIALVWYSLRSIPVSEDTGKGDFLLKTWESANKGWLVVMAVIAILSHLLRAERWRMLLTPSGHKASLGASFLSLMVGYLVNLVVPRGGEVSRCYNLYKLTGTPVNVSFGTVVVERIVDVICLLILIGISFFVEWNRLSDFIATLPIGGGSNNKLLFMLLLMGAFLVIGGIAWLVIRKNETLLTKIKSTWTGFRDGLLSVFRLEQKGRFIFYSLAIWFLYFIMSYAVIMAFPATSVLGYRAVLALFAIGSIAMAVPLPGGTGAYHVLVPQGLVFLYGINRPEAVAFTFIFHGWQTLIMIVGGAISLVLTAIYVKKIQASVKPSEDQLV